VRAQRSRSARPRGCAGARPHPRSLAPLTPLPPFSSPPPPPLPPPRPLSIFAELLGRKPIFKGSNTVEQLELVVKTLGTPTADELEAYARKPSIKALLRIPRCEPVPLRDKFPQATAASVALLGRMLTFDPAKRIGVDEALNDPYLRELHARATNPPRAVGAFDYAFEHNFPGEMPKALLQKIMFAEMVTLRADVAGAMADQAKTHLAAAQAVPGAGAGAGEPAAVLLAAQAHAQQALALAQAQARAAHAAQAQAAIAAQAALARVGVVVAMST